MKTCRLLHLGLAAALGGGCLHAQINLTRQPTPQVVSLGAHVTNTVTATSPAPPITYQWYGKGAILPGQTNRTLVVKSIQLDQAGEYYVVVNDADNQPVQSNPATVTVDPTFVKITEGDIVNDREPSLSSTWWDYDNDGDLDVTVPLVDPPSGSGLAQSFYRNDGSGVFTKIATNAVAQTLKRGTSGTVGDYDNDGDLDLYLGSNAWQANNPKDDLFRNEGNGRLTVVANGPWRSVLDHTWDPSFVDLNGDGLLDIFVVNYDQPACLYRQTPAGAFVELTGAEIGSILANPGLSYNAAWVDYDGDGDLDLWFEEYRGNTSLHRNEGNGSFTLATPASFAQSPGGMGVWADFDNDGYPELFVGGDTEAGVRPLALYRGTAGQDFQDAAIAAGVALNIAAWASATGDYDNDGWLDIFAVHWYEGAANPAKTNVLFRNRGDGTFEPVDVGSPVRDGSDERTGATWVDFDNDGFLDLFMICGNGGIPRVNHLYRNNLATAQTRNHWLKVKLNGQSSNRSGIGAKVRVNATINGQEVWQLRELTGNGYSQTCPGLIAHFGLGNATKADVVRVEWPSGNVQELTDVTADQLRIITEQVRITPVRPSSSLGGSVTLTAQLSGTWQWYHDGVALEGQTAKTLTLSQIQAADAGRYSVAVTTASGTFTNHVHLLVDTQFTKITEGALVTELGNSGTASAADFDNDGWVDLFVGRYLVGLSALYRNLGDGTFTNATDRLPFAPGTLQDAWGVWGDFDSDGWADLFLQRVPPGPAEILFNRQDGTFVSSPAPAVNPAWICGVDFNHDGYLDLYMGVPPSAGRNRLYRNNGDRTVTSITATDVGPIVSFGGHGTVAWLDYDDDGQWEIFSADLRDRSRRFMFFREDQPGHYLSITNAVTQDSTVGPIGCAWGDFDNDGRVDLFAAAWSGSCPLYRNVGGGEFERAPFPTTPGLCNYAAAGDYDNDGFLDLFITRTPSPNLLFRNNGEGTFSQITVGSPVNDLPLGATGGSGYRADEEAAYGATWFDYDNDGFLDLYVVNGSDAGTANTANCLYHNQGNANAWLRIKLVGTRSNRDGAGAKIRLQAHYAGQSRWQRRDVTSAEFGLGHNFTHFGLGEAKQVTTLIVEWPSGTTEEFENLTAKQTLTIVEPSLRGAMKPNGEFELSVWASTIRTCTIEHSPDLVNWTLLTTVAGQGETPVTVTDSGAPGPDHRFYRIR